MEQKSNVEYRAEKLYKNSREKFGFLLREVVSNSIHATFIRDKKENQTGYIPKVDVNIKVDDKIVEIKVYDNGEGFTEFNRRYFTHLDSRNVEKVKHNFHPQGQGRLSIVYFSDLAVYKSTYLDSNDLYRTKTFNYPEQSLPLFDIETSEGERTDKTTPETTVLLKCKKQQTFQRASTFFNRYDSIEKLSNWFINTFFPFLMENNEIRINLNYNGNFLSIDNSYIRKNVSKVLFTVKMVTEKSKEYNFTLWLVENAEPPKTKNQIKCFARHLTAEIENGKLEYVIDLPNSYSWFLTSEYFDEHVDVRGDKIEIENEDILEIQNEMNASLNKHFASQIKKNKKVTENNITNVKKKFYSLSAFIDESEKIESNKILEESDILNSAIENKGKAEKNYWINEKLENEDVDKLLNSSLQIYINHRSRILDRFHTFIQKFDTEGEHKNEIEDDIHDLFLKRGENLKKSSNINQLHNLWILDDKYTIFTKTFQALSSKTGQTKSDIYLWIDDPEKVKELLILELKSTTSAHNAGNKYEGMIAQVKRYATQFYNNPVKILNWDVDTKKILYSGVILARKSDIYKELNSNNVSGVPNKIPFLESSFFFNEKFSIGRINSSPIFEDIRIEMYSYEDIYELAVNRNSVFFKLINGEYDLIKT